MAGVLLAGAVTATACRADSRSAQRPQPPSTTTPPVSVTFAAATPSGRPADTVQLASTTRVLQARLDAAGIRGGTISVASGTVRVTVPAAHWRQQVAVLLAAPGRFELRPVLARAAATDPRRAFAAVDCTTTPPVAPPDKQTVVCLQPQGADSGAADADTKLLVGPAAITNNQIAAVAPPSRDPTGDWAVTIQLTEQGERTLQQLTATAACQPAGSARRQIAMVLDGIALNSVAVAMEIPCRQGLIQARLSVSRLTEQQARALHALATSGPLPVRLQRQP